MQVAREHRADGPHPVRIFRTGRRAAADDDRHRDGQGHAFHQTRCFHRPAHPAAGAAVRRGQAGLHDVLALEVRPAGIREAGGVHDLQLSRLPQCVQPRKRRVEAEAAVQAQGPLDADRGPQTGIVGVAHRRHGMESVHAAAQQHDQQPRGLRTVGGCAVLRGGGHQVQRGGAAQCLLQEAASTGIDHGHRSAPEEFRRQPHQGQRTGRVLTVERSGNNAVIGAVRGQLSVDQVLER